MGLRRGTAAWRIPLARGPGRCPGPAGCLPAADGADDHAGRLVRRDDRGRAGRPALAPDADRPVRGRWRPDPRNLGHRQRGGRGPDRACAGLRDRGRLRMAPRHRSGHRRGRGFRAADPVLLQHLVHQHRALLGGPRAEHLRQAGGSGRLRHAEAAGRCAAPVPDPERADAWPGLAGALQRVAAAHCGHTARGQQDGPDRHPGLGGRAPAAGQGRGGDRRRFGAPLRPDAPRPSRAGSSRPGTRSTRRG